MRHVFHVLQLALSLTGCILYPGWMEDGYLDDVYPMIGAFIGCYGGFAGGLLWYIDFLKGGKWL